MKGDQCEFCEGKTEKQRILARFRFKEHTIYIENTPAWVCNKCGEHYFDAPIYKRLEKNCPATRENKKGHFFSTIRI